MSGSLSPRSPRLEDVDIVDFDCHKPVSPGNGPRKPSITVFQARRESLGTRLNEVREAFNEVSLSFYGILLTDLITQLEG